MIRLREIELQDFRNTRYGKIRLQDLDSGASVLGLYGQNGSGKTSVVDAMFCLRSLLCGEPLPQVALDCIAADTQSFTASYCIEVGAGSYSFDAGEIIRDDGLYSDMLFNDCLLWYSVEVGSRPDKTAPVVISEKLSVSSKSFSKRVLLHMSVSSRRKEETGGDSWKDIFKFGQSPLLDPLGDEAVFSLSPVGKWRSLMSFNPEAESLVGAAEQMAYEKGTSLIFSAPFSRVLMRMLEGMMGREESDAPKTVLRAYKDTMLPMALAVRALGDYAKNDIHLSTTHRGGLISFNRLHIDELVQHGKSEGQRYIVLSTDEPFSIAPEDLAELEQTVDALNISLGSLVPGLSLVVKKRDRITDDDGRDVVRAELLSSRNGVRIPFRCESEGIQKLVSVLSSLVCAYNEQNACVVIDEVDSGVFEFLLGEVLEAIAEGGKGQLIFTAHNLRALETLPNEAIMVTTVNPDNRYIDFKGVRPSNNLRDMYLRSINLGGQKEHVYDPTDTLEIRSAFYDAGHPDMSDDDFDSFVESLGGSDGR